MFLEWSLEACSREVVDGCQLFDHLELIELIFYDLVHLSVSHYLVPELIWQAFAERYRHHHQQFMQKARIIS